MDEFSFPFQPYDIQLRLMREIRECIELGQIGIFESPTGTGKSLSVLCSTMTWLEEEEKRIDKELEEKLAETRKRIEECEMETEDWVEASGRKRLARMEEDELIGKMEDRKRMRERIEEAKNGKMSRKRKGNGLRKREDELVLDGEGEEKDEIAPPEEYHSDGEGSRERDYLGDEEEEEKHLECLKIYYASRTHSQLEQLVEELGKTRFRPRVVTCASRGTLCVNEDVRKLKLNHLINERCMELRKNQSSDSDKAQKTEEGQKMKKKTCANSCEFYNSTQIEDVVNGVLSNQLTTTLQVTKQGKLVLGCPYFATRKAVPQCQLVLLPYQVLLHEGTRQAWGIELKNNVVILDEAHNVLSTISSLYSAEVSSRSLTLALRLIREYIEVYRLRLKAKNLLYMKQLESLTNKMMLFLSSKVEQNVWTMAQFARQLNILEINLFKLTTYMEKTDLCKKFHGFYLRLQRNEVKKENEKPKLTGIQKLMAKKEEEANETEIQEDQTPPPPPRPVPSPLFALKSFIDSLTNKCEDGRILVEKTDSDAKLRFMLLNPADRLADVVNACRSTVLVGGTMEPAQLLVETLSKGCVSSDSIRRFSCSHVIDDSQLLAVTVEKTIDGKPFQLTFETRSNDSTLKSLALSLQALLPHLPNGVVIFLPSYDFLFNFQKKMKEFGIMKRIEEKKSVFTETRQPSSDLWERFSRAAKTPKGAIFFAVVGGKMSEGINFCDELGRAVIVIGLPYPNKNSIELRERMRFLDSQMTNGGSLLYESLCMHAVNQAIGRAIRHRKDYAAVYLFDERFAKESTKSKLSAWIGERTQTHLAFGDVIRKTRAFFEANKNF